jgi:hypothetical protein
MTLSPPAAKSNVACLPPEERFWKRYSPHYEFPLSGATSFTLHALGLILLVVGGLIAALAGRDRAGGGTPVDVVAVVPKEPVGDDRPEGVGARDAEKPRREATADVRPDAVADKAPPPVPLPNAEQVKRAASDESLRLPARPDGEQAVAEPEKTEKKLQRIREDVRRSTMTAPPNGSGDKGPAGGAKGPGPGAGGPSGSISQREVRIRRWTMHFDTENGKDYLRQLDALGAILALQEPDGRYRAVHDPLDKARGRDVRELGRMRWVDAKPESVAALAAALGLRPAPDAIAAFFPLRLEDELLQTELQYQERSRGRSNEREINETHFRIVQRQGRYEPVVENQSYLKP